MSARNKPYKLKLSYFCYILKDADTNMEYKVDYLIALNAKINTWLTSLYENSGSSEDAEARANHLLSAQLYCSGTLEERQSGDMFRA
jgi:hypothetical protein